MGKRPEDLPPVPQSRLKFSFFTDDTGLNLLEITDEGDVLTSAQKSGQDPISASGQSFRIRSHPLSPEEHKGFPNPAHMMSLTRLIS